MTNYEYWMQVAERMAERADMWRRETNPIYTPDVRRFYIQTAQNLCVRAVERAKGIR
jgi:hypothetical protein